MLLRDYANLLPKFIFICWYVLISMHVVYQLSFTISVVMTGQRPPGSFKKRVKEHLVQFLGFRVGPIFRGCQTPSASSFMGANLWRIQVPAPDVWETINKQRGQLIHLTVGTHQESWGRVLPSVGAWQAERKNTGAQWSSVTSSWQ